MPKRKADPAPPPVTLLTSRPPDRLEEEDAEQFLNNCSELTFNRDEAAEWLEAIPKALDALEQSLTGRSKEQVLAERKRVFEFRLRDWQQNSAWTGSRDGPSRNRQPKPKWKPSRVSRSPQISERSCPSTSRQSALCMRRRTGIREPGRRNRKFRSGDRGAESMSGHPDLDDLISTARQTEQTAGPQPKT